MDNLDVNLTSNRAEPFEREASTRAGHDAFEQADAGVGREGDDAEMGDARSDKEARGGEEEDSEDDKCEAMEDPDALKEKGTGSEDGEVVDAGAGALEAELDFEEKEKDWDADVEDEEIGAYASGEDIEAENVGELGDEQREPAEEETDGAAEAHTGGQAGVEAGAEREQGGNAAGTGEGQAGAAQRAEITLPLARVKRIVKLDPDIKQVSSDALKTIALATELFLGSLAESTAHVTRAGKRSMVKVEDLLQTIKSRRRYRECLGTDLEYLRPVDANQAARQEARQAKAKEKAARELPPGVKPITNFFKK